MTVRKALGLFPDQTTTQIGLDLDHLQAIGVSTLWLVLDVSWAFPTSTTIDATVAAKYDACINGANTRGMTVTIQAHGMPTWITTASGHTANVWHGPDTAGERTNWVTCLHNFINRYGATKIGWVEIWNEPHLLEFWVQGWNVLQYTQLLHDCYVDIKATWPTIKVVGHNMARNDIGWLQQSYAWSDSTYTAPTSAANNYWFDVLGIHPYTGDSTSGYNPADTSHADETTDYGALDPDFLGYRRLRTEILAKEGFNKPLAFGEFGYATQAGWFFVSEATRAAYVASAFNLANGDGYVEYFNVFYHRPVDAVVDHATSFNIHPTAGPTSTEAAFMAAPSGISLPGGRFNGSYWPAITVLAAVGSQAGANVCVRGTGVRGTSVRGGINMEPITVGSDGRNTLQSISRSFGRNSPIDSADPGTSTLVFNNQSGDYDATNADGRFGVNLLTDTTTTDTQPSLNYAQFGAPPSNAASSSGCTNSVVTMVAGGSLHDIGGASASTLNGTSSPAVAAGTFTFWNDLLNPAGGYSWRSVRWSIRPDLDTQSTAGYYWAHQGFIESAGGDAGSVWYAGLQSRSSLSGNPKAINFAIWEGVDAVPGDLAGTVAQPFTSEGDGYQVMAPYTWVAGRTYTMVCSADPARGPRWFSLHVRDNSTGTQTWVGSIRAAPADSSLLRGVAYHFSELFSQVTPANTCPLLPRATTFFATPTFSASVHGGNRITIKTDLQVVAEWPLGRYWPRFTGQIRKVNLDASIAPTVTITAADALEQHGRAPIAVEGPQFAGDSSGQRIHTLADRANWPTNRRAIDPGYSTLSPTMFGSTALELMRQVEMTEMGFLFVSEAGVLTFYDRHRTATASRSATVQVALTDTSQPGEVGMVELIMDRSTDVVYNDIELTRDPDPSQDPDVTGTEPGDNPSPQRATDAVSIGEFGSLNLPADLGKLHATDAAVLAQAQGLLGWYSAVQDRIESVTINLLHPKISRENLWPQLLSLTLLDRISVYRDYGPNVITGELLIQAISEDIVAEPPGWTLTLTTTNPTPGPAEPICVRGDGVRGTNKRVW